MSKKDRGICIKFSLAIAAVLTILFFTQDYILSQFAPEHVYNLINPYVFNGLFTISVFCLLLYLKEDHASQLGFVFLGASMLKFLLFFIFFSPIYKADGVVTKLEFSEFFVPYGVCLFVEVFVLIKVLMKD